MRNPDLENENLNLNLNKISWASVIKNYFCDQVSFKMLIIIFLSEKFYSCKVFVNLIYSDWFFGFAHAQYSDIDAAYTNSFAGAAMKKWEEMKVTLWGMFGRGF
jgi:hypothetical protein